MSKLRALSETGKKAPGAQLRLSDSGRRVDRGQFGKESHLLGDDPVSAFGDVLVDHRCLRGGVTHASHQLSQSRADLRGHGGGAVPEVVHPQIGPASQIAV